MRRVCLSLAMVGCLWAAVPVWAQFGHNNKTSDAKGPQFGKATTSQWRVGVIITAQGGPCVGIVGTVPVPTDWPEQQVRVIKEDVSGGARIDYRTLANGVKQMVVEVANLPAGETARALVTLEITRDALEAPTDTSMYSIPKKLDRDLGMYLAPSPMIESKHPKIVALAKELTKDKTTAWEKCEGFYDGVRERVNYQNGPLKGALKALNDGTGDCEEMTSLFIALCRATNIPARTVWVPEHCYPEFYLVDDEGKGHWFPCNLATNAHVFGGIPEERPILQKGDNFKDPDRPKDKLRYVSEFFKADVLKGGGNPKVQFMRDLIKGGAENGASGDSAVK